jgi:RimJ/RimL family protein N-acetyltransferase
VENIEFRRFASSEAEALAEFLVGQEWPFHHVSRVDRADVLRRAASGYYDNSSARTFWITWDDSPVGMARLFDLDDGTPLFDLRISQACRGKGMGTQAVRWLTTYLFTELPTVDRIEGTTRRDNIAMRRVFGRCGYVKEAHYRQAWPGADGTLHDTVGYGILREDWKSGTVTPLSFDDEPE